jgi:hypothetical protein
VHKPVLAKVYPCTVEEVRHSTQKERRIIDTLEPLMNSHKLIFDYDLVKKDLRECEEDLPYSLFYQLTRITRDRGSLKHDDRLDVLSIAVGYWVESMGQDQDNAVQSYRERLLDEELDEFMRMCGVGGHREGYSWLPD